MDHRRFGQDTGEQYRPVTPLDALLEAWNNEYACLGYGAHIYEEMKAFCEVTGIDATTPAEILGAHADPWTQHKCERVARYAARYAALVRTHLAECTIGAYMCPWTPGEYDGALRSIFAQDYALLAPSIDVFTPLIYVKKSGRTSAWGRKLLDQMGSFIPQSSKVQLILDVLDFPDSLTATAEAANPSWGIQMFGGAQVFEDPEAAGIFRSAVDRIRQTAASGEVSAQG